MPRLVSVLLILACGLPCPGRSAASDAGTESRRTPPTAPRRRGPAALPVALPATLEENRGQIPPGSSFLARVSGYEVHLSGSRARFVLPGPEGVGCAVTMRFEGAAAGAGAVGEDPLRGRSNYFLGNDPSRWVRDARHFGRARTRDLYPGVDLSWRPTERGVRYDFEVSPGASPAAIRIAFDGAAGTSLDSEGRLCLRTTAGTLRHSRPVAWQEVEGQRRDVAARFVDRGGGYGIHVSAWDRSLPLVLDPTVEFATLFGGGNVSRSRGCGVDSAGDIYVAGDTSVSSFPIKNGYQTTLDGDAMFVTKFGGDDHDIEFSTFIGSPQQEILYGMAVNGDGEAFVTARCADIFGEFPIVNAAQEESGGKIDGVVVRLADTGSDLIYSTYLGGSESDYPQGIAVDSEDAAWVVGYTGSSDFPLQGAYRSTPYSSGNGVGDSFLTQVAASGSAFLYSTYVGGDGGTECTGVAVGPDDTVWVSGITGADGMATTGAFQASRGGGIDGFLAAFDNSGGAPEFITYLGGMQDDRAFAVAVDAEGVACVVGQTKSNDFPTEDAYQASWGGKEDAFVVRVNGSDYSRASSTYLGGPENDHAYGVAMDPDGAPLVTGSTISITFPTVSPSQSQLHQDGTEDMFLTRMKPDGSGLLYSTFWGSQGDDIGLAVATDGSLAVVSGTTREAYYPEVDGRGETDPGQISAAILAVRIAPKPMRDLRITAVDADGVHLEWTDPHAGAYDVEVERRIGNGEYSLLGTVDAGGTKFLDEDEVSEDQLFTYRVRGVSASENTPYSKTVSVRGPFFGPSGLSASSPDNRRVVLDWTDNSAVETGYQVQRRTLPGGTFLPVADLAPGSVSHEDDDVEPETAYTYRIHAEAPSGATADTAEVSVTTGPKEPSGLLAIAVHDARIDLSWTDLSGAEESFEVERRDPDSADPFALLATLSAGTTSQVDGTVTGERAYAYRVRCLNANGSSGYSAVASVRTPPVAPSSVSATALSPVAVRVTWTDASQAEEGFVLERARQGSADYTTIATTGTDVTTHDDLAVVQESTYLYRVRAMNSDGSSRRIESAFVETPSELFIAKAARLPAKGAKQARLVVSGSFDPGDRELDLPGPAVVRVAGTEFPVPGFTSLKRGKVLRFEDEALRIDLKPSKSGGSLVGFTLAVSGPVAEGVDPSGPLAVEFSSGGYLAMGRAVLEEGKFDPQKGVGSRVHPRIQLTGLKADVATTQRHKLSLSAVFPPFAEVPVAAPAVSVSVGSSPVHFFPGNAFTGKNGKFTFREKEPSVWKVTLDTLKGTLKVKGANIHLGEFAEGPVPVRVTITVGSDRFEDVPVLVRARKTLSQ